MRKEALKYRHSSRLILREFSSIINLSNGFADDWLVNGKRIALFPSNGNRSQTLDFLRFVAVGLVLLRHSWVCSPQISPTVHTITQILARGGWIGVDLFFVLSGFLISGLLFKECQARHEISLPRFFLRRGFKIYPAFWALILFTAILEWATSNATKGRWILGELLFLQNYWNASQWGYTWSLAVEEHFYIFLPVLLFVLIKLSPRKSDPFSRIPFLFCIIAATCLALRLRGAASGSFSTKVHLMPTHLRLDSLFFGVLLSYFSHYHRTTFTRFSERFSKILIAGGIALLLPAFIVEQSRARYIYTFGYTEFYLGSGLLLIGFLGRKNSPTALTRCLALIGSRSYSIYLWHGPVFWFASERFSPGANFINWYGWTVTSLGGSVLMGFAMAALIENPVLLLRDRWLPSLSGGLSVPDAKDEKALIGETVKMGLDSAHAMGRTEGAGSDSDPNRVLAA